jgi:pimeloyl-ACP methyl ester carboxylesterase
VSLVGAVPGVAAGTLAGHPSLRVGEGDPLVVVSGLNDPLCRVGERAFFDALVAAYCRRCARAFDRAVYFVSRPAGLDPDASTRDMARGYADVLEALDRGVVLGLSMGGFVAHHLAAERPDLVEAVVFGLAADCLSPHGAATVARWREWADVGHWLPIYRAGVEAVFAPPVATLGALAATAYDRVVAAPRAPADFVISASACLDHHCTRTLSVPALVVGGTRDPFFSERRFRETARALDARFARLDGASHRALVHRAGEFDAAIGDFLANV